MQLCMSFSQTTKTMNVVSPVSSTEQPFEELISNFVSYMASEQLQLETNVASDEKRHMWESYFRGNMLPMMRESSKHWKPLINVQITVDFLKGIQSDSNISNPELYFRSSQNKVYIWAVVENNDEKSIDGIIGAVLDVNYHFKDLGVSLSPTIVERSQGIPVPDNYTPFNGKKNT